MEKTIERIVQMATRVLEDPEAAIRWLQTPQRALGNAIPIELARSAEGALAVERLLGRMEYGVYS